MRTTFERKPAERNEARRLRQRDGWSIKRIPSALDVSPGSVSRCVADIELSDQQLDVLRMANPILNGQRLGSERRRVRARATREGYQRAGRDYARRGDSLHLTGCML